MKTTFLFDLDGVLADTEDIHRKSLILAAFEFGYELKEEDLVGAATTLEKLGRKGIPKGAALAIYAAKRDRYNATIENWAEDPGLQDLFRDILSNGVRIGVCSNSNKHSCKLLLSRLGLLPMIDHVVTSSDVLHGKPSPEIYLFAMNRFKTTQESIVVFEDSEEGIKAAKSAGIHDVVLCDTQDIYERVQPWL